MLNIYVCYMVAQNWFVERSIHLLNFFFLFAVAWMYMENGKTEL